MIIGIDGNEANVATKVGIGEYAFELIHGFSSLQFPISPAEQGLASQDNFQFQIYLKNKPLRDLPVEGENWKYKILKPGKLWTQWRLPLALYFQKSKPDVFFTPSHYAPRFSPVPTVVSVMDLSYIHFPELFKKQDLYQLMKWTEYSVKNAKAIITISKSSKNDIIKQYSVPDKCVHVVYPGIKKIIDLQPHVYPMNEIQNRYNLSKNYILFVGTLQPRKNIVRLIEAFFKTLNNAEKGGELQLVIVGKKGWLYEEILAAPKSFGIEENVKFLDFVPDEDLQLLYKNATCYVLPSLYEGFGLPVLEAMKHGCPVITSNVSSLPEAAGKAALYVDPLDVDDIAKKMSTLINNDKMRKELIEKGKEQIKKFSWEKAAKETLSILQEVTEKY